MTKELKIQFTFERSTSGAHRFRELDEDGEVIDISAGAKVGTLYLRKTAIGKTAPKGLEMTLKTVS